MSCVWCTSGSATPAFCSPECREDARQRMRQAGGCPAPKSLAWIREVGTRRRIDLGIPVPLCGEPMTAGHRGCGLHRRLGFRPADPRDIRFIPEVAVDELPAPGLQLKLFAAYCEAVADA